MTSCDGDFRQGAEGAEIKFNELKSSQNANKSFSPERLSTISKRCQHLQVRITSQFRCGVLCCNIFIVFFEDSSAIIDHFEAIESIVLEFDLDLCCFGIDAVLEQFFNSDAKILDDLRRVDFVD